MRNKDHKDYYKVKELRKVIGAFNLMSGGSSKSYDSLILKIMKKVDDGVDFDVFVEFIRYELVSNYGLYVHEVPAEEIANSVENWWLNYQEYHT